MTISWPLSRQQVLDLNGRPILDVRARFFAPGTTQPIAVFADAGETQAHPDPLVPDMNGRFPRVYLPAGPYRERVFSLSAGDLWNDDAIGRPLEEDSVTDPVTLPDAASYAATGDVKWRLDGAILPGWVRMNGRTIGNAASGASEWANATAKALFIYLWQSFGDDIASVVGGRGLSALADFNAGKQITLPTMQGIVAAGLDDMGSSAAGILQVVQTLHLTAGSAQAQVADASKLSIGMLVFATGVSAGTSITDIAGNFITLSVAAAAGSTGDTIGRFGQLDAQRPGAAGGLTFNTLQAKSLPVNLPGGKVHVEYPPHTYTAVAANNAVASTGAGGVVLPNLDQGTKDAQTVAPGGQDFAVALSNPDGGKPFSVVQPTRVGTFYLKL